MALAFIPRNKCISLDLSSTTNRADSYSYKLEFAVSPQRINTYQGCTPTQKGNPFLKKKKTS